LKEYEKFMKNKSQLENNSGFDPVFMPDFLFDFQKELTEWGIKKGRCATFADCGLGKTPIQLVWAQNIVQKTNKNVLIVTPLSVSAQTIREGEKFNIECRRSIDGKIKKGITITNYERLHYFDRNDFAGIALDESSAIKNFDGKRQKIVTEFMRETPYRSMYTATASPNDYIELGTSAGALGQMGRMDMLGTFFKNDENSLHPIWWGARWRFKAHAEEMFWRWVCSWARAMRKPSDMGYKDDNFKLPPLKTNEYIVNCDRPFDGELFVKHATTLQDQRKERKITLPARCEKVADLVENHETSLIWCHLNAEGDYLEKIIPGAKQIKGSTPDEEKEQLFLDFQNGKLKRLITKPKIGAFGLNFQNCSHMTFFPSHSFEQYYQGVRRCWRYGQQNPVTVDIITTEGETGVLKNLQRKAIAADIMFENLVKFMNNEFKIERSISNTEKLEVAQWM